jgi:hypothetical protein
MQNDAPSTHLPAEQSPEQQPPPPPSVAVQGLPAVEQLVLSGAHEPPVQVPLQHWAEVTQVALSAVQVAVEQTPRAVSHCRLQQSVATAHELPAPLQIETDEAQVFATGSHDLEQHCASVAQEAPATVQMTSDPPVPGPPLWPAFPPAPVLMALMELLPQPGIASRAAASSVEMAAIEIVVGESLIRS